MITWRNIKKFFYKLLHQPGYAARVLIKRARAYFYYNMISNKSSWPEAITLFLTHRCNLQCKMCGQWGEGGVTKKHGAQYIKEELSFSELSSMIDDITLFKPNITLFGGEPLLYTQITELIRYIKKKDLHCLLITNGALLENFAQQLVDSCLDELNISLDGGETLHDEIRGMPGLFAKIIKGIEKVNRFKAKDGKNKPLLNLQCTINKENYRYLEQMIEVAEQTKANSITFHNLIFLDEQTAKKQKEFDRILGCSSLDWEGFVFEPRIDPQILYEKIKEIRSREHPFGVYFYPDFSCSSLKEYYCNPCYTPLEYPARCISPWVVGYVFPDGEFRPCLNLSYSYGNIKQEKLSRLWNNEKALNYRRCLKKNKIFPACVRCTELYRY